MGASNQKDAETWKGTLLGRIPRDLYPLIQSCFLATGQLLNRAMLKSSFGEAGQQPHHFNNPYSIAMDPFGTFYVAGPQLNKIQAFTKEGTFLRCIEGSEGFPLLSPIALATDLEGNLVIVDIGDNSIKIFTTSGQPKILFPTKGCSQTLYNPRGVAVDHQGNIVVVDCGNNLIKIFSPTGTLLRSLGEGYLASPSAVAISSKGDIVVVNRQRNNILIFHPEGELLQTLGQEGLDTKDGSPVETLLMKFPWGIALDKEDNMVITDNGNRRILIVAMSGQVLQKLTSGIKDPMTPILYPNGDIIIVESTDNKIITLG